MRNNVFNVDTVNDLLDTTTCPDQRRAIVISIALANMGNGYNVIDNLILDMFPKYTSVQDRIALIFARSYLHYGLGSTKVGEWLTQVFIDRRERFCHQERWAAIEAYAHVYANTGDEGAIDVIQRATCDPEQWLVARAAAASCALILRTVTPRVEELLTSKSLYVVWGATYSKASLVVDTRDEWLIENLMHKRSEIREATAMGLASSLSFAFDSKLSACISHLLDDEVGFVSRAAALALASRAIGTCDARLSQSMNPANAVDVRDWRGRLLALSLVFAGGNKPNLLNELSTYTSDPTYPTYEACALLLLSEKKLQAALLSTAAYIRNSFTNLSRVIWKLGRVLQGGDALDEENAMVAAVNYLVLAAHNTMHRGDPWPREIRLAYESLSNNVPRFDCLQLAEGFSATTLAEMSTVLITGQMSAKLDALQNAHQSIRRAHRSTEGGRLKHFFDAIGLLKFAMATEDECALRDHFADSLASNWEVALAKMIVPNDIRVADASVQTNSLISREILGRVIMMIGVAFLGWLTVLVVSRAIEEKSFLMGVLFIFLTIALFVGILGAAGILSGNQVYSLLHSVLTSIQKLKKRRKGASFSESEGEINENDD